MPERLYRNAAKACRRTDNFKRNSAMSPEVFSRFRGGFRERRFSFIHLVSHCSSSLVLREALDAILCLDYDNLELYSLKLETDTNIPSVALPVDNETDIAVVDGVQTVRFCITFLC